MLYEAIFKRRAVRKYDMTPLDAETLSAIRKLLDETEQMPGQNARFEIVSADKVKGAIAPHYIMSYCKPSDAEYANVGYVLQKADLYIQSLGFGSLWLGMAKPKEKELDFCIMLAFGKTDVPFRTGDGDFNRLPLSEISTSDSLIAQAARLAPSACNSQPWKLHLEDTRVTVRYFGRGLMKIVLKPKMSKVDIGIVTRHIVTALEHEGKAITTVSAKISDKMPKIEIQYR